MSDERLNSDLVFDDLDLDAIEALANNDYPTPSAPTGDEPLTDGGLSADEKTSLEDDVPEETAPTEDEPLDVLPQLQGENEYPTPAEEEVNDQAEETDNESGLIEENAASSVMPSDFPVSDTADEADDQNQEDDEWGFTDTDFDLGDEPDDEETETDDEEDEEAEGFFGGFYRKKKPDESDSDKRELHPMKIKRSDFLILAGRVALAVVLLILSLTNAKAETQLASLLLILAAFLVIGADLFYKAVIDALEGQIFNNNLLVAVAAIGAFCIGHNAEGVVLLIIYQIGTMLIRIAVTNSHKMISRMLDLRPTVAHLIRNDAEEDCSVSELLPGDLYVVHPGERLPVDGLVVSGESNVDASQISGESRILTVGPGDALYSGSVNMEKDLTMKAVTSYSDSTVSRILNIVDNAEEKKGESERFISKFSKIYTPCAFAAALIVGVIVPLVSGLDFAMWLSRGINILVIACPGALLTSVPLTYFAGIARAAVRGVLFKGADVLDTTSRASMVVFNKNATITTGKLGISAINPISGVTQSQVLTLAGYAVANSSSAVARCILEAAGPVVNRSSITRHHEEKGKGYVADIGGRALVIAGTRDFLNLFHINCPYEYQGLHVLYVCQGKDYVGSICLDNLANQNIASAIREIRRNGADRIILLSDESADRARETANAIGITESFSVHGAEEREARLRALLEMSMEGDKLLYVGDSDEDAPLLRAADVGVTVRGIGTQEAVAAADVITLSDDPAQVAQAMNVANGVQKITTMNMIVALGVKTAVMLLSAVGGMLMWIAALVDLAVSLFTIVNAMRAFDPERFGFQTLPALINPVSDGSLPSAGLRPERQRDPASPRARQQNMR